MSERANKRRRRKTRSDRRRRVFTCRRLRNYPPVSHLRLSVCLMRAKGNHAPSKRKGKGQMPGGEHASARTWRGRPAACVLHAADFPSETRTAVKRRRRRRPRWPRAISQTAYGSPRLRTQLARRPAPATSGAAPCDLRR